MPHSPGQGEQETCGRIEQSVTIIPNLRAANPRRRSLVDYAFPELHPEVGSVCRKLNVSL